jgi:hypothetical protein
VNIACLFIRILKKSFNVTRFQYVEMYYRLGIKEFGHFSSSIREKPLIKEFNSAMKLLRTQTNMQGDRICDFQIILD